MKRGRALTRSEQMARIRGKDTSPEQVLRKELWKRGVRYRLKYKIGGIQPDLVLVGRRVAVFVDGCFWHGCPEHYVLPRSRQEFWQAKLAQNVARDIEQIRFLHGKGWTVLRVWEHEVFTNPDAVLALIQRPEQPQALLRWMARGVSMHEHESAETWEVVNVYEPSQWRLYVRNRSTAKWKRT